MSRKFSQQADSLDLLLDTICNTFGGVLFLALLVVVLLNMSGSEANQVQPDVSDATRMQSAQREWKQTRDELERLRVLISGIEAAEPSTSDPEVRQLLLRVKSLSHEQSKTGKERDVSLENLSRTRRDTNEQLNTLKNLAELTREVESKLAEVTAKLKDEQLIRSKSATAPRERSTSKQQVAFLLVQGKLCACFTPQPNGELIRNDRETKEVVTGGSRSLEPIPANGLPVSESDKDKAALEEKLKRFDRNRYFATVLVWPDSFEEFGLVRGKLVKLQMEYQLIPWSGKNPIRAGTVDQKNINVQ